MVTDVDGPQYACARTDVDMTAKTRDFALAHAQGNLLENQAVWSDTRIGVNDYAVGVWHQQAALDLAVQRNIRARDDGPESMSQNCKPAQQRRKQSPGRGMPLVRAQTGKQ